MAGFLPGRQEVRAWVRLDMNPERPVDTQDPFGLLVYERTFPVSHIATVKLEARYLIQTDFSLLVPIERSRPIYLDLLDQEATEKITQAFVDDCGLPHDELQRAFDTAGSVLKSIKRRNRDQGPASLHEIAGADLFQKPPECLQNFFA